MGFLDLFKGKSNAKELVSVQSVVRENVKTNPNKNSYATDYAKAIFLYAYGKASPIHQNSGYVQYLNYECGITNPVKFHKELIAEGYLEKSSIREILSMYKVDELKQILDSLGEKKSGKKDELIERILQTSPGDNLAALESQHNCYSLSEKGRLFLDSHDDYVTLHLYRSHWSITVEEYEDFKSKMQFQGKFNDVVWGIFNKRVLEYLNAGQFGSARCAYYNMTELLRIEEKFQAELETLLLVQFYDLCGVDALQSLSLYKQGIYTKKELSEFCFGIAFAPAIVSRIIQLQEYYHPDMVDRLYQNIRCPIMLCTKQEFLQILNEMFTSSMFDTEKYEKQLRKNFLKMIK